MSVGILALVIRHKNPIFYVLYCHLKIYNILVLPTFLYGSENWTLTALQRRRIEAAEMKLLRPLAGYTLYDHKTNDSLRLELQTEYILDKITNTDGTGFYTCKECHKTESLWYHITADYKEGEQLEDRRNVGKSSYKSGDGTDQRVQTLMFMMMTVS